MKIKNEKGITLVELLAVLVLVSLVATLVLTTFTVSFRYNITETKKMKMQQDANYIVSAILQKHRTVNDCYELNIIDEGDKLVFSDCKTPAEEVVLGEGFKYELSELEILLDDETSVEETIVLPVMVKPKAENLQTTLKVTDPNNDKLFVTVDTLFKRYKSNKNDEEEGEG